MKNKNKECLKNDSISEFITPSAIDCRLKSLEKLKGKKIY
jgi:hypothetical protein